MRTGFCVLGGALLGAAAFYGAEKLIKKFTLFGGFGTAALPASAADAANAAIHIRQIRRYAFAASQDKSPVVGITHASYALVLLDTLEEIAGPKLIAASGYDTKKLRAFITGLQDRHAEQLHGCDPHLQQILALERRETGGQGMPGFVVAGAAGGYGGAPRGA